MFATGDISSVMGGTTDVFEVGLSALIYTINAAAI